jgi:hypothetical protein
LFNAGAVGALGETAGRAGAAVEADAGEGAVGAGDPEASLASSAFNAIALLCQLLLSWRKHELGSWTDLLRSASALAPPGPGREEYPPA